MIKFFFHLYNLEPIQKIGVLAKAGQRSGGLLKCVWPDGKTGYADVHPWPELGDDNIEVQLSDLKKGKISNLLEQSIWLARRDALLRAENKSAFEGLNKLKNHYLISDCLQLKDSKILEIKNAGFTTIKIKVGVDLDAESKIIAKILKQHNFLLRLDFNSSGDLFAFEKFMSQIDLSLRSKIEFIEDPMPWDFQNWSKAKQLATLAIDQTYNQIDWNSLSQDPPFKVLILKPARQDVAKALDRIKSFNLKLVVTSSLDHPVGIMHAASVACELKKQLGMTMLDCGLLSFNSYRLTDFNQQISQQGPFIQKVKGVGIGFDTLLESLSWTAI